MMTDVPPMQPNGQAIALDDQRKCAVAKLDASEVGELLHEYGRRKMLLGGNRYRAKAYVRAAENLALLTEIGFAA